MDIAADNPSSGTSAPQPKEETWGDYFSSHFKMSATEATLRLLPIAAAAVFCPPRIIIPTVISSVLWRMADVDFGPRSELFAETSANDENTSHKYNQWFLRHALAPILTLFSFGMSAAFTTPDLRLAQDVADNALIEKSQPKGLDLKNLKPMHITRNGVTYTIMPYLPPPESAKEGTKPPSPPCTDGTKPVDARIEFEDAAFFNTRSSHRMRKWDTSTRACVAPAGLAP